MKVLVTGGTGFIGSAVIRHLLAAGHDVRILARTKKNRYLLDGLDVEIVDGNITSIEAVKKAVKGCSVVFDLAAVYAFYPFWEKEAKSMYRINVEGTRNLLNCALEYGVKRFIHTSTIATISKRSDGQPSDEQTGFNFKEASHYARSKHMAEQEVLNFCQKGLNAVILNPGIVFGERDYKPTPSGEIIVKFLNRQYPVYFDTIWSVVDVDDVAHAHVAAIQKGETGQRYILCDKNCYSMKELFHLLQKVSGVPAPKMKISHTFLSIFVYLDEWFSCKILNKKPLIPSEGLKFCRNFVTYDNKRAVKELGYMPTPIEETLRKAVNWYRNNGYIKNMRES